MTKQSLPLADTSRSKWCDAVLIDEADRRVSLLSYITAQWIELIQADVAKFWNVGLLQFGYKLLSQHTLCVYVASLLYKPLVPQ